MATQHINDLRVQLGSPAIYNEPAVHNHAVRLASLRKSYGISTLPQPLMNRYNIKPASNLITSSKQNTTSFDLAALVILYGSSAHTAGTQYKFIAQCQKAAHAILTVQTKDKRNKYDLLLRQNFLQQVQQDQLPDFDKFAKIWSTFVDRETIFFTKLLNTYATTIANGMSIKTSAKLETVIKRL